MRTLLMIFLPLLLVGCDNTAHEAVRHKIPAKSLEGEYYTTHKLYIDDELIITLTYGDLSIRAANNPVNEIIGLRFDMGRFIGGLPSSDYIPEPGSFKSVRQMNSLNMPVNGAPYDGNFEGHFLGIVQFYGEDPKTMYNNIKEITGGQVSVKGWMKERRHYYDENGFASYNCEISIEFTVEGNDYKVVITEAQNIYLGN